MKISRILLLCVSLFASFTMAENVYDESVASIMQVHASARNNVFFKSLRENTIKPKQYLQALVNDWTIYNALENSLGIALRTNTLKFVPDERVYRVQALESDITFFKEEFSLTRPNPTRFALQLAAEIIKATPEELASYYVVLNVGNLNPSRIPNYVQALLQRHGVKSNAGGEFYAYQASLVDLKNRLEKELRTVEIEGDAAGSVRDLAGQTFQAVLASYTEAMQVAPAT